MLMLVILPSLAHAGIRTRIGITIPQHGGGQI